MTRSLRLPNYVRVTSGALLSLIALFNIWMAPQQMAVYGMFHVDRQPQYGLFILGIANAIFALALVALLARNSWTKRSLVLLPLALITLIILTAYSLIAGFSASNMP
jgi:hypothetical protein